METKRNLKYFTSKGITPMGIVALALIAVGVVFMLIDYMYYALIFIGVGLGLYFFFNGGKASGDDIEYQVGERVKDMRERGMIRFELAERSLKHKDPFTVQGYEFDDQVYYKKGSDGRHRTSVFSAAILFFTGEKIHIHRRRFSFIDEELDEELGGSYRYIDLDHAEVREFPFERTVGKINVKQRIYHFVLVGKDGQDVLDMCVDYGADIDKACLDINRIIEIRTQAHYEKVARVEADRKARMEAAAATAENQ